MKRFPKSILRACCAIAGGVVLVQYREQAVMWITVGIGIVFLYRQSSVSLTIWLCAKQ